MARQLLLATVALALVGGAFALKFSPAFKIDKDDKPRQIVSLDDTSFDGFLEALANHEDRDHKVLAVFYAPWCKHSKQAIGSMEFLEHQNNGILTKGSVGPYSAEYGFVRLAKIDMTAKKGTAAQKLKRRFGIRAYPFVTLIDPKKKLFAVGGGTFNQEDMTKFAKTDVTEKDNVLPAIAGPFDEYLDPIYDLIEEAQVLAELREDTHKYFGERRGAVRVFFFGGILTGAAAVQALTMLLGKRSAAAKDE